MKINFIKLLTFKILILSFLASCSKKDDPAPITNNATNTTGSYMPTTKGSTWSYSMYNYDYTDSATGNVKQIGGANYSEIYRKRSDGQSGSVYINRVGNKYYSTNSTNSINLKIIDLDLPIGNTWTTTLNTNTYTTAKYEFKVIGTGLTRTVNNIDFKDVIAVQLNTTASLTQAYIKQLLSLGYPQSYIDMMQTQLSATNISQVTYYAQNVGIIEQTSDYYQLQLQLLNYKIK